MCDIHMLECLLVHMEIILILIKQCLSIFWTVYEHIIFKYFLKSSL